MKLNLESTSPSGKNQSDSHSGEASSSSVQHFASYNKVAGTNDGEDANIQEEHYNDSNIESEAETSLRLPKESTLILDGWEIDMHDGRTILPTPEPSQRSMRHCPNAVEELVVGRDCWTSKSGGDLGIGAYGVDEDAASSCEKKQEAVKEISFHQGNDDDDEAVDADILSLDSTLTSVPTIGDEKYEISFDAPLNRHIKDPEQQFDAIETKAPQVPNNGGLQVSTKLDLRHNAAKYNYPAGSTVASPIAIVIAITSSKAAEQPLTPFKNLRTFWEGRIENKSNEVHPVSPEEEALKIPIKDSTDVPDHKNGPSGMSYIKVRLAVASLFALIVSTTHYISNCGVELISANAINIHNEPVHNEIPEEKEDGDLHCFSTDMTSFASMPQWEFNLSQNDIVNFFEEELFIGLDSDDDGASCWLNMFIIVPIIILVLCLTYSKLKAKFPDRAVLVRSNNNALLQGLKEENRLLKERLKSAKIENTKLEQDTITLKAGNTTSSSGDEEESTEPNGKLKDLEEGNALMKEQVKFDKTRNTSLQQETARLQERVDFVETRNATLEQDAIGLVARIAFLNTELLRQQVVRSVDVGVSPTMFEKHQSIMVHFHGFDTLYWSKGQDGAPISSPSFKCFDHEWRVVIYPTGGFDAALDGMSSLYLRHLSEDEVTVKFGFVVKSNTVEMVKEFDEETHTFGNNRIQLLGWPNFIKRSDLLKPKNLNNGTLAIELCIAAINEGSTDDE